MAGRETHTGDEFTHPAALTLILDPMAARRRRRRAMVIGALGLGLMGAYGAVGLTVKMLSLAHLVRAKIPMQSAAQF